MTTLSAGKSRFVFVGTHLDDLADGHVLEPGVTYTLTKAEIDHPHNARLIATGLLLELAAPAKPTAPKGSVK